MWSGLQYDGWLRDLMCMTFKLISGSGGYYVMNAGYFSWPLHAMLSWDAKNYFMSCSTPLCKNGRLVGFIVYSCGFVQQIKFAAIAMTAIISHHMNILY